MNLIVKTLDFAPGERFLTSSNNEFPTFIATSAFIIGGDNKRLAKLVAVDRPERPMSQGVPTSVREITISLPNSLASAIYPVGGESNVSLSVNVDQVVSQAISGTVTLGPQLDDKLSGSFDVSIEDRKVENSIYTLKASFTVKLPKV